MEKKYLLTALLLVAALVLYFILLSECNKTPLEKKCINVYALAYSTGRGVAIPIEICAVKGNGLTFLNMDKEYDYSFQETVKTITALFRLRHGSAYDFYITIKAPSSHISGPSAGTAIYAGMYSLLKNVDVKNTAFSGKIDQKGNILPVGEIKKKIESFGGTIVLPSSECIPSAVCVSNINELEDYLNRKKVNN